MSAMPTTEMAFENLGGEERWRATFGDYYDDAKPDFFLTRGLLNSIMQSMGITKEEGEILRKIPMCNTFVLDGGVVSSMLYLDFCDSGISIKELYPIFLKKEC
jgi:hypothetical protein